MTRLKSSLGTFGTTFFNTARWTLASSAINGISNSISEAF